MNQKVLSKVLATMLAVILTFANFIMLGVYTTNSYASEGSLENQNIVSNNPNVKFDAYFVNDKGNKIHTIKEDVDSNLKLFLEVQVEKGYLRNAKIKMLDKDGKEANFRILNESEKLELIENIDVNNNTIALKQINSGKHIVLEIPITSIKTNLFDLSNFSKVNGITLMGSYVDNNGKQIEIEKTINTKIEWKKETNLNLEQELKTFIPYEVNDRKGTIIQTILKSGLENNGLPIKQTKINIKVPQIDGKKPEEVVVIANSTKATNNQQVENFTNENWSYNKDTGIVEITVLNEPNENKVVWNKDVKDEYTLTYIYNEKVDAIETEQNVIAQIEAYNSDITKLEKEDKLNIKQESTKGNIIGTEISANNELSKGYVYSNVEKELEYFENVKLDIGYVNLVDKIVVQNKIDKYMNSKDEENSSNSYYKTTTISKENFLSILGEEGYIKIIGKDGERLSIITKDTLLDENGNYTYIYPKQLNEIKIETSKPVKEGTLEINHVKLLEGKNAYSKNQIADFQKLQLKVVTNVEYANTVIENIEAVKDVKLTMPSTKIDISVNRPTLSTIIKNENVEFRAILKTNSINCDLYKNPTLEIVLPSYIEEINIKDINLLFDNELKIKEYNKYINDNGNQVIVVVLQGEQTTYSGNEVSKGANIVINTDITLKKLSPTKDDVIKVYVTNENVTSYENVENTKQRSSQAKGYVQTSLKAVAPIGLVTTNTISGYNSKNETVTSISGEAQVGKLDAKAEARTATVSTNIINNYENKINNISILGRMPKSGNKSPITNVDLGSNFDVTIAELIKIINPNISYKIYYTENSVATEDIQNPLNGWKDSINDVAQVQSYLIEFIDYEMQTGDTLSLEYKIRIPENLNYDKSIYTNYVVYFDNIKATETIKDKALASKVGLSTGEGPHLEVEIGSNKGVNAQIQEGDFIIYTIYAKNTGKTALNNITLSGNVPEGTTYVRYEGEDGTEDPLRKEYDTSKKEHSENIDVLASGETKTIQYEVKVNSLSKVTEKQIEAQAKAKVAEYDAEFKSKTLTNKIVEGYLNVEMKLNQLYMQKKEGQDNTYSLTLTNANMKDKEDVVVTDKLPDGVSFVEATNNGVYDEKTNTVTWNVGTIGGEGSRFVSVTVKINELQGETRKDITNSMIVKTKEREIKTEDITFTIIKPMIIINQTSTTNEKVSAGDLIEYNVTVKNIGEIDVHGVTLRDYMPQGLLYRGSTYVIEGEIHESWIGNRDATIDLNTVKAGQTIEITLKALVEDIPENKIERKIINIVELTSKDTVKMGSNEVSHTIVEKTEVQDPSVEDKVEGTYKITGLAWLDSNRNGKRDDEEQKLSDIRVILVDSNTGKIVKDPITGISKEQVTNETGVYTFSNVQPGKYLVVFFYDTENYSVTKYKENGVIDSKNSDVVSMKVTLNGTTSTAAVANSINIQNSDVTNIDMGLIKNAKFDLKLDKTVSKIVVNNSKGSKEYKYNDAKFAKVDIQEKQVEGSTVIVEYKIKVTNEGEIPGYAKKIVDYIPSDMTFSAELNQDWYMGEARNAYNASLANTLINPGETKEVTLVLTKKMTNENTGTINNVAEIYEASNDYGIKDIDSTEANKVQGEDDYSLADVVIGVKTGEVYVYITITLISITMLGIGIYFINKKVLRNI